MHFFIAMNLLENLLASTVCCLLLYHKIVALLINMMNPVCNLLVFLLAAWNASTNAVIVIDLPPLVLAFYVASPLLHLCTVT